MAVIFVRYAEIGLKSTPVRMKFENRLKENMLSMLVADRVEAMVTKGEARFYVETDDMPAAIRSLKKVFGIASLSVADVCSSDLEDICSTAARYSAGRISQGQSFAVKARREGNHHAFTSVDVGREAGSAIFLANESKGIRVDLTDPDVRFYIEVRNNKTYIFDSYVRCHAGLPMGTQGKVVAEVDDDRGLVSAWLMMKRGCKVCPKGSGRIGLLANYDPNLKDISNRQEDPKKILGYVMGTTLEELDSVDVSKHDVPVYFPTIGMTDAEVQEVVRVIEEECI